jgi:hypothetical protein
MCIWKCGVFEGKHGLETKSHQVQSSKCAVPSVFKCKPNLLPRVARTKVLLRNIPERQDEKIGVHTTRPPILIAGMLAPKSHIWRGKNSKLQEMTRGGRRTRTILNWAQDSRSITFLAQFALPTDLGSPQSTYSSCLRRSPHPINPSTPIHQKPPPQDEG